MTKEIVIDKFKESCKNPIRDIAREKSVRYQRNRKLWQIEYDDSAIRIQRNGESFGEKFLILIWEHYYSQNTRYDLTPDERTKPISFRISEQEFNELEAIYCDLTPNIIL